MANLPKLKPREAHLTSLVIVAILLSFVMLWQRPRARQIREMGDQIAALRSEISQKQTEVLQQRAASQIPKALPTSSARLLDNFRQNNRDHSAFLRGLAGSETWSEVELKKVVASPLAETEGLPVIPYALELTSSFKSLVGFFRDLEGRSLLFDIQTIEIERKAPEIELCASKIKLVHYVLRN